MTKQPAFIPPGQTKEKVEILVYYLHRKPLLSIFAVELKT